MSNILNVYILNTIFAGTETINILKKEINIKGIIGLKNNFNDKNIISGFDDMSSYCKINDIEFIGLESYSLKNEVDKQRLLNLNIDILIVSGWQRLIPKWLIDSVKIACLGAHGSPWGIEKGRGRSPINWSLILGKEKFLIAIFKINPGIDSGEIIDEQEFSISQFDDVNSIYYKVSWSISQMIIKYIKERNFSGNTCKKQNNSDVRYLPKRNPEDGEIDWYRTNNEIYNYIRALTKPYPGAFTYIGDNKIFIWRAIPFDDMNGFNKYKPGEIIKYYSTHDEILVKCGQNAILVKDYSSEMCLNDTVENKILSSADFMKQINAILSRHYSDHIENKCNEELENIITSE